MSKGRSLSLPMVAAAIIIAAVLASGLTYYHAMLSPLTVTTTSTITSTVTRRITVTRVLTSTKYVTLHITPSPSTTTLTVTTAKKHVNRLVKAVRNDAAALRLAGFRLRHCVLTSIMIWFTWLVRQSKYPTPVFYQSPAGALASLMVMRLTLQPLSELPPLTREYEVRITQPLITIFPTQLNSTGCPSISVLIGKAGTTNLSVVIRPVNDSVIISKFIIKSSKGFLSKGEDIIKYSGETLRILETLKISSGPNSNVIHSTQVIHNGIPVELSARSNGVMREAGINSSNGELIVKVSGGTVRTVKGFKQLLEGVLKSLRIKVTYLGMRRLANGFTAPEYRVRLSSSANVRAGNISLNITLTYYGTAYLLGNNVMLFTANSISRLVVTASVGGRTYCSMVGEPLTVSEEVLGVTVK